MNEKAVIIMDQKPKSCRECIACIKINNELYCKAGSGVVYSDNHIPDNCHAIGIPEKDAHMYSIGSSNIYKSGWNDVLESILCKDKIVKTENMANWIN